MARSRGCPAASRPADIALVALGTCQEIMYAALASTMDTDRTKMRVR